MEHNFYKYHIATIVYTISHKLQDENKQSVLDLSDRSILSANKANYGLYFLEWEGEVDECSLVAMIIHPPFPGHACYC